MFSNAFPNIYCTTVLSCTVDTSRKYTTNVTSKGVGPGPTLAWPCWKQPDIPVEVDTDRLGVCLASADYHGLRAYNRLVYTADSTEPYETPVQFRALTREVVSPFQLLPRVSHQ